MMQEAEEMVGIEGCENETEREKEEVFIPII